MKSNEVTKSGTLQAVKPSTPKTNIPSKSKAGAARQRKNQGQCSKQHGEVPSCQSCNMPIRENCRALNCDKCMGHDAWKCAGCLDLSDDAYDSIFALANVGAAFYWLCTKCERSAFTTENGSSVAEDRMLEILNMFEKLMGRMSQLEAQLGDTVRLDSMRLVEERLTSVETKIENRIIAVETRTDNRIASLEARMDDRINSMDTKVVTLEQMIIRNEDAGVGSASVPDIQARQGVERSSNRRIEIQDRQIESDREAESRRNNVILHRVDELESSDITARTSHDRDFVLEMFGKVMEVIVSVKRILEELFVWGNRTTMEEVGLC